jgi:hypothetical protein
VESEQRQLGCRRQLVVRRGADRSGRRQRHDRRVENRHDQHARKARASLDALAVGTARLADGNASARAGIEELRKRGVTVNAAGASKPQ